LRNIHFYSYVFQKFKGNVDQSPIANQFIRNVIKLITGLETIGTRASQVKSLKESLWNYNEIAIQKKLYEDKLDP